MDETWWRSPDQLDPDQQKIVSLPLEGSHLVTGPPGSGKTNLLLLRATFLTRAGMPNLSIITYNRVLKEFLVSGSHNYPFEPERIQTFRSWAGSVCKSAGIDVDTDCGYEQLITNLLEGLSSFPEEDRGSMFDCILIDEAQDYSAEQLRILRSFATDIFAVGDNNQRIYKSKGGLGYLKSVCNVADPLSYHYRNGRQICRLADGIMNIQEDGMVSTCNYDEATYPSTVSHYPSLSLDQQVAQAAAELETQLLAYPDEWIGVLAPRKADVTEVFNRLMRTSVAGSIQLQKYADGYDALDRNRPVIVTTMHSAKGLEFRATHLLALDQVARLDHHQRVAYTAVTRAKTSLSLYHHRSLPGYLDRGLVAVSGAPSQAPRLSELFGDSRR